ncbi:MAG: TolB family protein, partial [Armatimonadota bacterium]
MGRLRTMVLVIVVVGTILVGWQGAGRAPSQPAAVASFDEEATAFRIRFGLKDEENTRWDGQLSLSQGEVLRVEGWRFAGSGQGRDEVVGTNGWKARTRPAPRRGSRPAGTKPRDNGVIVTLKAPESATAQVTTQPGDFSFKLADVPYGTAQRFLDGAVEVARVAPAFPAAAEGTHEDFPAAAVAEDGTIWLAYIAYTDSLEGEAKQAAVKKMPDDISWCATPGGGDQLFLRRCTNGRWAQPIAVTKKGLSIYRPAVAVGGDGRVWVIWTEKADGNWDLFARPLRQNRLGRRTRLSRSPGPDWAPAAATMPSGEVVVVWQGAREDNFDILMRVQTGDGWSKEIEVAATPANEWDPAVAIGPQGQIAVAWDTYQKGDYDVHVKLLDAGGTTHVAERRVAASLAFEARASLAWDPEGRLWIAWEQGGARWGKDWGALVKDEGIPLYQSRTIGVRCLAEGKLQTTMTAFDANFARPMKNMNSFPRLAVDGRGRLWLLFRHREPGSRQGPGTAWLEYATTYDGDAWSPPILLPDTDGLLDGRPPLLTSATGNLLVLSNTDGRQHRGANRGVNNDIYVAVLSMPEAPAAPQLQDAGEVTAEPEPSTEEADVARIRGYRLELAGKTYQPLRGEFHRHTEISGDGGGDGPMLDTWRYALDAAQMDWIGNGDHDNGGGREYTWWLIQKQTDMFLIGDSFMPMYTYERSVRYPEGHRNVMFARRGIRTLPRLGKLDPEKGIPGDTKMLYKYLRAFDGICAVHTSATDMGTDWRDNDPRAEPIVEIYQGCRQNYEMPGAPRSNKEGDSLGGFREKGYVSNALAKGYRLGFQSSSDHI